MSRYFVALALFAAGCATPGPTETDFGVARSATRPVSQEAAEKAVIEHFQGRLKDPDSARYRFEPAFRGVTMHFGRAMAGWIVCGWVNARNSYGGYTGFTRFIAQLDVSDPRRVSSYSLDDGRYEFADAACERAKGSMPPGVGMTLGSG